MTELKREREDDDDEGRKKNKKIGLLFSDVCTLPDNDVNVLTCANAFFLACFVSSGFY